jgi:hypothetical protein
MQKVHFVLPHDTAQEDDVVYIGNLKRKALYPAETKVRLFASFTRMTATLAPLLLLSDVSEIQIHTSHGCTPITITADKLQWDIEERIDNGLHMIAARSSCIYRNILGDQVLISDHNCNEHERHEWN